jgi:hypothetical protein
MLPFTVDDFFSVFAAYNRAIWPAQVVAYALGLVALAAAWKGGVWGRRVAAIVLGAFWLWNGAIYHFAFFAQINPAAYAFAALFLMQGLLFLCVAGVASDRLFPNPPTARWRRSVGLGLIAYAAVVYELLSHLQGHGWPHAPILGVAPCPTTIFTIGILILLGHPQPIWLIAIPLVWAVIGSTAAVLLAVREDFALLAAAILAAALLPAWPARQKTPSRLVGCKS